METAIRGATRRWGARALAGLLGVTLRSGTKASAYAPTPAEVLAGAANRANRVPRRHAGNLRRGRTEDELVTLGHTSLRSATACWKQGEPQGVIAINATVRDVMTTSVVAVRKDASFKEMVAMLRSRRISAFPVLDDQGRVIGVVSEGDLLVKEAVQADGASLLAALRHLREDDKAAGVTAGDLMTGPAVTIGPDAPVEEAARLMYDRRVKRLPVVNTAGLLLGIISRVDVLTVFNRPDEDIRDEVVHQVLPGITLVDPKDFTVVVSDGIVTIGGERQPDELGRAIMNAIRHVQGVVAVRDRLGGPGGR